MSYSIYMKNYRNFVVGVDTKIPLKDGKLVTAINFDNAATTPPLTSVLQEVIEFSPWYSSVHRGTGYKSKLCSNMFERSRMAVMDFVNADSKYYTVIFVKNTTEALNKLSYRLCDGDSDCVILSTGMEHHSNDLPWRSKYKVDYIAVDSVGRLSMGDLETKLRKHRGNVKLVTVTGASNVTGYKNNIHKIAALVHKYGAKICVDGAQLVPHVPVSMMSSNPEGNIDFLAFSAHKMYAPFGIGVLVGLKDAFKNGEPDYVGGGTVKIVTPEAVKWDDPPHKEEAGSPNIMGIAALMASIRTLNMIGMDNIESYEQNLTEYTLMKLKEVPLVRLYGNTINSDGRVAIIPFNIDGIHHSIVAQVLSEEAGIAVRNGCFCAQPYIQKLLSINKEELAKFLKYPDAPRPGMVRISFGFYNNFREIDVMIKALKWICENKDELIQKYKPSKS